MTHPLIISTAIGLINSYIATFFCHRMSLTIHPRILQQRRLHFVIGIVIASLITGIYWYKDIYHLSPDKIWVSIILMLSIPAVIYTILPKSHYTLQEVASLEQVHAWFKIYLCMKYSMLYGFFIGFFFTLIIMYIFCM